MQLTKAEIEKTIGSYPELFTESEQGIGRIYTDIVSPIRWSTSVPVKFLCSPNVNGGGPGDKEIRTVTYQVKASFDLQVKTTMHFTIPALKLTKKAASSGYQFRLSKYVGYKITPSCQFGRSDGTSGFNLDTHSQIALFNCMTKPGSMKKYLRKMGMTTVCKKWCTEMPETKLFYVQQFSYGASSAKAVATWKLSSPTDVHHTYNLDLSVEKCINMRLFDTSKMAWVECPVDMSLFDNPQLELPVPVLYGKLSTITQEERAEDIAEDKAMYYLDMIDCDPEEGSGTLATMTECPGLPQVLFWFCENLTSHKYNITCNYTSDVFPNKDSQTPINLNSLKTEKGPKFSDISSDLFDGTLSGDDFNYANLEPGILAFPLVDKLYSSGNNGGNMLQKIGTKLTCSLTKGDSNQYRFRFRVLTLRKVYINKDGFRIEEV